ncbi:hypothetical protein GF339_03530 [candidate division KSB3 bacterium]|uniref:Response regulatory domain-containing protein n=1 Tax=candidate division KSB3 bacterium TaxID=2044937 RepID=A0A9D5JT67_9BACT|nr:hypothetical protein [candidate division KSB3 bacterium]MBD3323629.1 hypothetical protein [candidate division KSB3 bacterium]
MPILYITAYADDHLLQRAKITTPFGYICKPIQEDMLRTNIEIALYNHQQKRKLHESEERFRGAFETSGIGIPPDKLSDIFAPFQQIHHPDIQAEGTGGGIL